MDDKGEEYEEDHVAAFCFGRFGSGLCTAGLGRGGRRALVRDRSHLHTKWQGAAYPGQMMPGVKSTDRKVRAFSLQYSYGTYSIFPRGLGGNRRTKGVM